MNFDSDKKEMIMLAIFGLALILFALGKIFSMSYQPVAMITPAPVITPVATATPDLGVEIGTQIKEPGSNVPNTNPFTTSQPSTAYENPFK